MLWKFGCIGLGWVLTVSTLGFSEESKMQSASSTMQVEKLQCEYRVDPLGIDIVNPRLSWALSSKQRAQKQHAFQILVASTAEGLAQDKGDLWDSGKQVSDQTAQVVYAGKALAARQACYWKVRVWDSADQASDWSAPAYWSVGLLDESDWQAQWIGQDLSTASEKREPALPWLRNEFALSAKPVRATAYVAAMGYYELYLDGNKVDDHLLSPAVSDYRKRAYYITHDVTEYVKAGKNCVGLWLGRGWYYYGYPGVTHRGPIVRAQIEVELDNGETVVIGTDENWKTHASPLKMIGKGFAAKTGERYDARDEIPGWNRPDLDDAEWTNAVVLEPPVERLVAQRVEPNRLQDEIKPVSIKELEDGKYMVDMGRNFTGWLELHLTSHRGKHVNIQYIEDFLDDGEWQDFGQRDTYIPATDKEEVFRSRFNYHAFQYVCVSGLEKKPELSDFRGWLVNTDFPQAGTFSCSNDLLTRIYETVVWTYRCVTMGGYAVDCPQRERLGYGGDGQVTMETGLYAFQPAAMYTKWLANWRDTQNPNGSMPNIAPDTHGAGGGPTWGAICVLLPWQLYLHYADTRVLADCYPMMQQYLSYLDSLCKNDIMQPIGHPAYGFIGDWVAPGRDQEPPWSKEEWRIFFNTTFYAYLLQETARVAEVIEKGADAARYRARADEINKAAHAAYFNADTQTYSNGEQPYLAFPLLTDMPPADQRDAIVKNLEHAITVTKQGHLNAGMHGIYFLLKCLNQIGRDDLIFTMTNKKTYPGWGYMLEQGATTIWERWNGKHSRSHSTLLAIGSWFPAGIGGIQPDPRQPGFQHILIQPRIVGDLTWAKASHESLHGLITTQWRREDGKLSLEVSIPANTTATVVFPTTNAGETTESGKPVAQAQGVRFLSQDSGVARYEIGSGSYHFQTPYETK